MNGRGLHFSNRGIALQTARSSGGSAHCARHPQNSYEFATILAATRGGGVVSLRNTGRTRLVSRATSSLFHHLRPVNGANLQSAGSRPKRAPKGLGAGYSGSR